MSGYADLVAVTDDGLRVLDFETDAPPAGPVEDMCQEYMAQVRGYARLLAAGGAGAAVSRAPRFTADGSVHRFPPGLR